MTILITGASGTIGQLILQRLATEDLALAALVRSPAKTALPAGVREVVGDMNDPRSMRAALSSVRTLFLLNAVTPEELTQALLTLNLAREAGIERIVYLSVIHADRYTDVPHFTGKHTVERMIDSLALPVTILRPAYFMQNDRQVQSVVQQHGIYPMPIGHAGVRMIDVRDIADIAAIELLARHRSADVLPARTLELVGPHAMTGTSAARVWSEQLGRDIGYGGDDLQGFEQQLAHYGPGWPAYDMRLMMARIQTLGMHAPTSAVALLEQMLGRPLRSYGDAVRELLREAGSPAPAGQ